ncbi:trypsin-like peptidase domain-containing protein [Nocardioides sp. C4-1]|uniref:trypsin-like peptidase domain-containing protein n=1 Tax=Nocardioides sp. C4-1 TaxID=3151851 RepID=UPI0032632F88
MAGLTVRLDGRVLHFDGSRPVRVGRALEADVVLTALSVSRSHAELRPDGDGWVLVDAGSQFGTFTGRDRVRVHRLDGAVDVQCGPETVGSTFTAEPIAPGRPLPAPASVHRVPRHAAAPEPTMYGGPRSLPERAPQPRTGPDLFLVARGEEHRFRHPAHLRVGSDAGCEVVVDDEAVSPLHGQVDAVPGGWVWTDLSDQGTFRRGRRTGSRPLRGRLDLRLGHPVAGPRLILTPVLTAAEDERRIVRRRRRRLLARAGGVAAALLLVAATVVGVVRLTDDASPSSDVAREGTVPSSETAEAAAEVSSSLDDLTATELDRAKAATVLLTGETEDDDGDPVTYTGSGTIISSDGLILTNAHVAMPEAEGLASYYGDPGLADPDHLRVSLVEGDDDAPAAAEYLARPVEVDGRRDVAVMQVYATVDGAEVDPATLDLPVIPVGDSDELESGDDVTVLGFPGISGSTRLTVTKGVISTFIDRSGMGPRSEIDTDTRIAPGNSGGAAINNDAEIIGIPSSLFGDEGSPVVSGRIRPVNVVLDLIEAAERR